ncbi:hypothetical protein K2O51_23470 [Cupriavidus pinatubonensis]|uniref:hypothetical protein n=1 Tax=Cupriavidus pinatubonensis TaxID=248026 RepID=UPI001C73869E|nr:hypothetical protein [Cupriavidus pinatubonensis]QYY30332.1 hypothetical protein K2O51_23470 [Cupriavidus pinatubonensis]
MKKRSRYQMRAVGVPMMPFNKRHVELTYYADLVSFISAPTDTAYNRLMRTLELVAFAMEAQNIPDYRVHLRSTKLAMSAVFDRSQHTGRVTVLDLEAMTLRAAAAAIEQAISRMRLDTFNEAHFITKLAMQAQGAPVEA